MSRQPCCSAIFLTNLVITKHAGCSQTLRLEAGSAPPLPSPQSLPNEAGSAGSWEWQGDFLPCYESERAFAHESSSSAWGPCPAFSLFHGAGWADAQELRVCPWAEGLAFLISCDNSEVLHLLLNQRGMLPRFNKVTSSWSWFSSRKCHNWAKGKTASWQ